MDKILMTFFVLIILFVVWEVVAEWREHRAFIKRCDEDEDYHDVMFGDELWRIYPDGSRKKVD